MTSLATTQASTVLTFKTLADGEVDGENSTTLIECV
jgi:hypothetical protein